MGSVGSACFTGGEPAGGVAIIQNAKKVRQTPHLFPLLQLRLSDRPAFGRPDLAIFHEIIDGHQQAQPLSHAQRQPHAVHAEEPGQHQDGHHHEEDGAAEGQDGGGLAVVEGGEPAGGEDVISHEDKAHRHDAEASQSHIVHVLVALGEEADDRPASQAAHRHHGHASHGDGPDADAEGAGEAFLVALAQVVADDRGDAGDVAPKHAAEQLLGVPDDGQGGHAVGACQVHEDVVKEDGDDGEGQDADHFRCAVGTALQEGVQAPLGTDDAQSLLPLDAEPDHADEGGHCVPDAGGDGGTGDAPMEDGDEEPIQHHVEDAAQEGKDEAQVGLAHSDVAHLEDDAEDGEGDGDQDGDHVRPAEGQQGVVGA